MSVNVVFEISIEKTSEDVETAFYVYDFDRSRAMFLSSGLQGLLNGMFQIFPYCHTPNFNKSFFCST